MERIFNIRDWWGNGITLWIVVLILFTSPLLLLSLKDVSLENDITTWLPKDDPDAQSLEWFSSQFARDDQIILSWDSSSLVDERVEALADRLEATGVEAVTGIDSISTPRRVIQTMVDNRVSEKDAVDRVTGVLVGIGFLKVELTELGRANIDATRQQVQELAQGITAEDVDVLPPVVPFFMNTQADQDEKEGSVRTGLLSSFQLPRHDFQLRWPEITSTSTLIEPIRSAALKLEQDGEPLVERVFFAPGAPVAIAMNLAATDDDHLISTLQTIEDAAIELGVSQDELRLAGSPVSRLRLNQEAKRAVINRDYPAWNLYKRMPIILSALVGVIASFILLKSVRLSILVTAASVYTSLVVVSLIPLTGQSLNMVLIVLPDLLLVLTTSGAIHVANYWKHAVTQGESHPVATAVKMAMQPCLLASLTTAIGMASLLTAVLEPVQQFGFYSSIGCFVSLAMILIGFPSMMAVWPGGRKSFAEHAEREATLWGHFASKIIAHRRLVTSSCLVLFVFSVYGLRWFQTETKVIRYFPPQSQISRDYHYLEEGLSGIVSLDTVIRFDQDAVEAMTISERMQLVRDAEQAISNHSRISGTLSLSDFRDPVVPPEESASTLQKIRYGRTLQRIEKGIFEEQSEQAAQFARKASQDFAIRTAKGRPFGVVEGDEIWRIRAQSVITGDVNYSNLTGELEQLVAGTLQGHQGTDYLVTGMVPLFLRTQQAVLESLIKSFGLAFVIIALVMMVLLWSPTSGLLAMLPNLFPVGVVFGLVAWSGMPVDIGTMITASVALGIAIDGTLHLLTWYRDGIKHGMTQQEAVVLALQHCGPAMWQTSATIALGIIIVSGADLLLISRFGILMAGLVTTALVADVVLLPALLGGWLGRIIARNTPVVEPVQDESPVTLELPQNSREEEVVHQPSIQIR